MIGLVLALGGALAYRLANVQQPATSESGDKPGTTAK